MKDLERHQEIPRNEFASAKPGRKPKSKQKEEPVQSPEPPAETPKKKKKRKKPSQATLLFECCDGIELFQTADERGYASVEIDGHVETMALRSKHFCSWLRRTFHRRYQGVPSTQALTEAVSMLEGKARYDGPTHTVWLRVARVEDAIYVDLGDKDWRAIEITASGWRVVDRYPVKFRRTKSTRPLPEPVKGAGIGELERFLNVATKDGFHLLVSWLIGAFKATGPYPILVLQGEQGCAKSTMARVLRNLIDPVVAPLRRPPRDERDLNIAANSAHVLNYDNLSGIRDDMSDAFCSLSTGGGFSTRQLTTDSDEVIIERAVPIIVNGINTIALRGDFADRSIVVWLSPIEKTKTRTEQEFWSEFHARSARILGAVLDGLQSALRTRTG